MILNKKELSAVLVLAGSGVLGWGLDLARGDRERPVSGLRVEADTAFCKPIVAAAGPVEALTMRAPKRGSICINTATAREFEELPGIGPALSRRIIEFRDKNDGFKTMEDVMLVKGVGIKKFEQIKNRLVLSNP